jgi:hypothetical protein
MDKNALNKFLNKRDGITTIIELAFTLFRGMGKVEELKKISVNKEQHEFGCVLQFFGFIQSKILVDNMFMNFITVIGSANNQNILLAWEKIPYTKDKINDIIKPLREIRLRYADARIN